LAQEFDLRASLAFTIGASADKVDERGQTCADFLEHDVDAVVIRDRHVTPPSLVRSPGDLPGRLAKDSSITASALDSN
jgi:hypothetical protein